MSYLFIILPEMYPLCCLKEAFVKPIMTDILLNPYKLL